MVNSEIRMTIYFAAKDGEVLYSQQKQDWEMTVAQIMNFLLLNKGEETKGKKEISQLFLNLELNMRNSHLIRLK